MSAVLAQALDHARELTRACGFPVSVKVHRMTQANLAEREMDMWGCVLLSEGFLDK